MYSTSDRRRILFDDGCRRKHERSALAEKSAQRTIQLRRRRSIVGVTDDSKPLHCGWRRRRDESDVGLNRRSMHLHSCPGRIQQAPYRTNVAVSRCLLRVETGRRNQYVGSTVDLMMHIPFTSRTSNMSDNAGRTTTLAGNTGCREPVNTNSCNNGKRPLLHKNCEISPRNNAHLLTRSCRPHDDQTYIQRERNPSVGVG